MFAAVDGAGRCAAILCLQKFTQTHQLSVADILADECSGMRAFEERLELQLAQDCVPVRRCCGTTSMGCVRTDLLILLPLLAVQQHLPESLVEVQLQTINNLLFQFYSLLHHNMHRLLVGNTSASTPGDTCWSLRHGRAQTSC